MMRIVLLLSLVFSTITVVASAKSAKKFIEHMDSCFQAFAFKKYAEKNPHILQTPIYRSVNDEGKIQVRFTVIGVEDTSCQGLALYYNVDKQLEQSEWNKVNKGVVKKSHFEDRPEYDQIPFNQFLVVPDLVEFTLHFIRGLELNDQQEQKVIQEIISNFPDLEIEDQSLNPSHEQIHRYVLSALGRRYKEKALNLVENTYEFVLDPRFFNERGFFYFSTEVIY